MSNQNRDSRTSAMLIYAVSLAFALSLAGSSLKSTVQVYFTPIANDLNAGVGLFAWSTTVFALFIAVASPIVGGLADRFGGSAVLVVGTILSGIVFFTCAIAHSALIFAPVYGFLGAFAFTMLSYVPLGKLADELFAGRGEGLAYAIMTNGPAVGFIVLVPAWVWLGNIVSWRFVFAIAGAVMLLVCAPTAVFLMRRSANQAGQTPVDEFTTNFLERIRTVLKNKQYWVLTTAFVGCGVTMAFIDVHMVTDMTENGMDSITVSSAMIFLGVFEIAGSLLAGRLCDKGWVKLTLLTGYLLRTSAMVIFSFTPTMLSSFAFGIIFGVSYMATVVATTIWVAKVLPKGARGTAMGLVWTLHSIGAAASSQFGAMTAERFGSYTIVCLAEAVIVLISFLLILALPFPGTPRKKPPTSINQTPLPVSA